MSSLQAHLERHDLAASPLGFRRDCPLCRAERVQGHLPSTSVVPLRARATIAAALLAGSALAPGPAVAADGQGFAAQAPAAPPAPQASDLNVGDGGAAPVRGDHDAEPGSADQDSGGGRASTRGVKTEAGPDSVGPTGGRRSGSRSSAPSSESAPADPDDSATVQQSPAGEPGGVSLPSDAVDGPQHPAAAGPSAAPAQGADHGQAAPRAPVADSGDAAAPSESDLDSGPNPSSAVSTAAARGRTAGTAQPTGGSHEQHRPSSRRRPSPSANAAPGSDRRGAPDAKRSSDRAERAAGDGGKPVADETPTGSARERTAARRETEPSDTYRVRSGDSLWRIAEHRLGPSATATDTAQEVTRLWELNRQRIGTGNPDLILPGQTLRM